MPVFAMPKPPGWRGLVAIACSAGWLAAGGLSARQPNPQTRGLETGLLPTVTQAVRFGVSPPVAALSAQPTLSAATDAAVGSVVLAPLRQMPRAAAPRGAAATDGAVQ